MKTGIGLTMSMNDQGAGKLEEKPVPDIEDSGRNQPRAISTERPSSTAKWNPIPDTTMLFETMLRRENMLKAHQKVFKNKGAPGVDNMTVGELKSYLQRYWPQIKEELVQGKYRPKPVKEIEIPKPDGGVRKLGIPTVLDRLIQQALHQVISPIYETRFSESSYGFRPGRSAYQAVRKAQNYIAQGKRWVVDLDLEKFFDTVNHDILMSRIERTIKDKRILKLIRKYLQTGIMKEGIESYREEGTPQGGPLSPLLSNILLDDLDKELERRKHDFCRYADDCNIYVGSEEAGQRVMSSIKEFLKKKLKLRVNENKSAVARLWHRKFLGYSVTVDKETKLKVSPQAITRLKDKLKEKFKEGRGQNLKVLIERCKPLLTGWMNYFKLAQTKGVFEELDSWIRQITLHHLETEEETLCTDEGACTKRYNKGKSLEICK